jgi:hypothetical protein
MTALWLEVQTLNKSSRLNEEKKKPINKGTEEPRFPKPPNESRFEVSLLSRHRLCLLNSDFWLLAPGSWLLPHDTKV